MFQYMETLQLVTAIRLFAVLSIVIVNHAYLGFVSEFGGWKVRTLDKIVNQVCKETKEIES